MIYKYSVSAHLSSLLLIVFVVRVTSEVTVNLEKEISNKHEDNSISNQDDNENNEPNKFSWSHHQDDHSIYAHRSLMSTANIEHHNNDKSNELPQDDDENDPLKTIDYPEKEWQLMFRSFDLKYNGITSSILQNDKQTDIFEDIVSKLKTECRRDIYHVMNSVKKHKLWALRMLDSNGKLPSGITYGKFSSPGDYEECLSVNLDELVYKDVESKQPEHYKFRGKYCLLDFRLPLPERPSNKLLSIHESVLDFNKTDLLKQFPDFKNYSGYASVFYEVGYMHAFCLPSTCDVKDLTKSVGEVLEGLHIIVNNTVDCQEKYDEPLPWRKSQIISLTLIIILVLNAIGASIIHFMLSKEMNTKNIRYEISNNEKLKEFTVNSNNVYNLNWLIKSIIQYKFYAECFSIQANFKRLSKPDPRGLSFIHYTRIVAMALTVITHTAGMGTLQAITKPADTSNSEQIFRDFLPQMLANAFTTIQIFFFMAGLMLVISTGPSITREKGHLSFVEYAIKRAIRLMPGLAATIGLNFLWPLIVDGPMLRYFTRVIIEPCEKNWWRTMAFLSNFDHVEKMCLRHSYFAASDYQLHIIAFPLLILLYRQPTLSLFIAGLLTIAGFVAQVIMILTKTVLPFMMIDYIDKEAFFNVVHYIHHPVWNHMSAFFYGYIIGYLVIKQIRINISDTTIKRIWLIILPAGIASVFAPYFWNHYRRPIYRWQMVLYVLFDRFLLLTTCAWLSYASMVLKKKSSNSEVMTKINLPVVVSLEKEKQDKKKNNLKLDKSNKQSLTISSGSHIGLGADNQRPADTNQLKAIGITTNIPRQRSSPNFLCLKTDNDSSPTIRSSISITNIDFSSANSTKHEVAPSLPSSVPDQEPKKRAQPSVSNVNILCLILSRLTFQLYLFNMVVLWIDVNHSKYNWYFSYYFIITKAFAIYISSSLLAMVFFVTLESPCLTLYILWVKSRAEARANSRTKCELKSNNKTVKSQATNGKISSSSSKPWKEISDDKLAGLCRREGVPDPTKLTFSIIELSTSSTPAPDSGTRSNYQTKM